MVCRESWVTRIVFGALLLLLVGTAVLISAEKPAFTNRDKAYFADPNTVAFVRPGLKVSILSAEIAQDGTITTRVRFADPMDLPLDRDGIYTPGAISASLLVGTIPAGKTQYVSYITRSRTTDAGASVIQATSDSGGSWEQVAEGEYVYTFSTKAPSSIDRSATHTVGMYVRRDLEEWDLGRPSDDAVFSFVPDGSPVTVVRDVVTTETCNGCHDRLTLHGRRHSVELCNLCHTPQTSDGSNGNTADMKVMIHKIHMGSSLPSVEAGGIYEIGGNDYSHVAFPADVIRCESCHKPDSGATQANLWTKPDRAACGSCHDNVNFDTGENHAGLPQPTDNLCSNCHIEKGEVEFDLSIRGAHLVPTESAALPGVVIDLVEATGKAGEKAVVTFTAQDKAGNPIAPSELNRLRLYLIGPTGDYGVDPIVENAGTANGSLGGRYTYTFTAPIPAGATGSWAVSVEARQTVTLLPGTVKEMEVRDIAYNDTVYFPVDGSAVKPRRAIVDVTKCNACHASLGLHGGNRNNPEICVMCHRPNEVGEGLDDTTEESIDLRVMVHRIHTGAELDRPYAVGGHDYSHLEYPGRRNNCEGCHIGNSQQLPLGRDLLPVTDPSGWLNPIGPEAAACTACHSSIQAASHALANTSALGESCAACHGPGKMASVDAVHAE